MPALERDTRALRLDAVVDRTLANFAASRFTRISIGVLLGYFTLAILLPAGWLAEVFRCAQMTFSAVVIAGYWRPGTACFYITRRWPSTTSAIALGILLSWVSIFANSFWSLFYRLAGQPSWMINNDFYTGWTALSSYAACLHIVAPNMLAQDIPKLDKRRYWLGGVIGVGLIVVVGFWRPDFSALAEVLREYIAEPDWMRDGLLHLMRSPSALWHHLLGFA